MGSDPTYQKPRGRAAAAQLLSTVGSLSTSPQTGATLRLSPHAAEALPQAARVHLEVMPQVGKEPLEAPQPPEVPQDR
eukprot:15724176-Heterocapsa_arctica.AAC.1